MQEKNKKKKAQTEKPDETLLAMKRMIALIDDAPITNFSDLMRMIFKGGSDAQMRVLLTKTSAIQMYIDDKNRAAEDRAERRKARIRRAYSNRELHDIENMSRDELLERLQDRIAGMSRRDIETLLAFISGEHGVKLVLSREESAES